MIKVCGMRDAENIREVEALGIDLMGFIFWTKSSRYVSERPAYLPTKCKRVGVFVDEDIETVKRIADEYALDYIQLHGHESPDYIRALRVVDGFPVDIHLIKAISVSGRDDIATYKSYEGLVDYFLFDTKCPSVGGSGQQFDWSLIQSYAGELPFLLSGGIGPADAPRICQFRHPLMAGVDVNSRFESAPGLKDPALLKTFIHQIRQYEQNQQDIL